MAEQDLGRLPGSGHADASAPADRLMQLAADGVLTIVSRNYGQTSNLSFGRRRSIRHRARCRATSWLIAPSVGHRVVNDLHGKGLQQPQNVLALAGGATGCAAQSGLQKAGRVATSPAAPSPPPPLGRARQPPSRAAQDSAAGRTRSRRCRRTTDARRSPRRRQSSRTCRPQHAACGS